MFRINGYMFLFVSLFVLSSKNYCPGSSMPQSLATTPEAGPMRMIPGFNIPPALSIDNPSSLGNSCVASRSQTPDAKTAHGKENLNDGVNIRKRQFTLQFNKIAGPAPFVDTEEAAQGVCDQLRGLHDKYPDLIKHRIYEQERNDKTRHDHYGDLCQYLAEKAQERRWSLVLPPSS